MSGWPADFITEGHDQTRGWFLFSTWRSHGPPLAGLLRERTSCSASPWTSRGARCPRALANIVQPEEVVSKFGADILRSTFSRQCPWEDLHFSWEAVENTSPHANIFWNATALVLPYMVLDGIRC